MLEKISSINSMPLLAWLIGSALCGQVALAGDIADAETDNSAKKRHLELGDRFVKRQDYTNALIEYELAVRLEPENVKAQFMLAKVLIGLSDYKRAEKILQEVVFARPRSSDAHLMLAESYRLQGKLGNASRTYRRAIKLNRKNGLAYAYAGECARARNDHSGAIYYSQKALAVDPKLVVPHLVLAELCLKTALPDIALSHYKQAIALNSNDPFLHIRYGNTLIKQVQIESALLEFGKAAELAPKSHEAHLGLSWALASTGKTEQALDEARIALSLAPNSADAHATLAWIYQKKNNQVAAKTHYKTAVKLNPTSAELRHALAACLNQSGDLQGAIAELIQATHLMPDDSAAKLSLSNLLERDIQN